MLTYDLLQELTRERLVQRTAAADAERLARELRRVRAPKPVREERSAA